MLITFTLLPGLVFFNIFSNVINIKANTRNGFGKIFHVEQNAKSNKGSEVINQAWAPQKM